MTVMRVAAAHGMVLTYDTDDVENIELSTPADVRDVTPPFATAIRRELTGDFHLHLHIDFKHGKKALWVKEDELGGEVLPAATALEVRPEIEDDDA